jgi:hypothetical protein
MGELMRQIPMGDVLIWFVCYLLGIATAWTFARRFARFQDAVINIRARYREGVAFFERAKQGVFGMVTAGAIFLLIVGAVGAFVWGRVAAG